MNVPSRAKSPGTIGPIAVIPTRGGSSGAQEAVLRNAGQYCAQASKHFLLESSQVHFEGTFTHNDAATVTFRCLADGDPELRRPNMQPVPNVVIQDQRH
jgi:hypothetical protein